MTVSWNIRPEEAWGALVEQETAAIEAEIVALVDRLSDEAAVWMRANHAWENVTGEAEAGLYADIEHVARQSVTLLMSHGPAVWYAWYLEYSHAGRFAILADTSDRFWPVLLRGVTEIVRQHSS